MLDIQVNPNRDALLKQTVEAVGSMLSSYRNLPVLFLVSGGSCFDVLNALPSELFDTRLTVGVVDERFTGDEKVNNYLQLTRTPFYEMIASHGVTIIESVPQENESVEGMAKRYETELKGWRMSHADGVIVSCMGIGRDGHTAGIMAYPDDKRTFEFYFEDADSWVVGYDASWRNPYPLRVTTTCPFLRSMDAAVVYVVGEEKKKALTVVLAESGELHKTPGRIIREMKHCLLYTDQSVDRVEL